MRPNVVVGGGIVGLAVAGALQDLRPEQPVVVLEKETELAGHQTGHNSGVIHSGLYYAPGSLRARLAASGAGTLKEFCSARDIAYDVPGKLVVATSLRSLRHRRRQRRAYPSENTSLASCMRTEPPLQWRAPARTVGHQEPGRKPSDNHKRPCSVSPHSLASSDPDRHSSARQTRLCAGANPPRRHGG